MSIEKIVVMADGCFDPVHEGHINYLKAAKELGTKLVVNIAKDEEIWLKRPQIGPFLVETARTELIRSFRFVDDVILVNTPDALKQVRPNIYAKGLDWKGCLANEELEICSRLNIDIQYLNTVSNSSSKLINKFIKGINKLKAIK
jgi:cytidyltransferase-like protein